MTQEQWERSLRAGVEYADAVEILNEIERMERELAELRRAPSLESESGQLARLDRMQARMQAQMA